MYRKFWIKGAVNLSRKDNKTSEWKFIRMGLERFKRVVWLFVCMRNIHITLDNNEYDALEKVKDKLTWKTFFMQLAIKEVKEFVKKLEKKKE